MPWGSAIPKGQPTQKSLGDVPAQVQGLPVVRLPPGGAALAGRAAKPGQTAGPPPRGHHWVKEMGAWDRERTHASCRGSALSRVWSWQAMALLLRGSGRGHLPTDPRLELPDRLPLRHSTPKGNGNQASRQARDSRGRTFSIVASPEGSGMVHLLNRSSWGTERCTLSAAHRLSLSLPLLSPF